MQSAEVLMASCQAHVSITARHGCTDTDRRRRCGRGTRWRTGRVQLRGNSWEAATHTAIAE